MHVRVRLSGKRDTIIVIESKLTKIEHFRRLINDKLDVRPKLQQLFYGGKLLENGYTIYDYNIKLNDVIQLMIINPPEVSVSQQEKQSENETQTKENVLNDKKENDEIHYEETQSQFYLPGDLVDVKDIWRGSWCEAKILNIVLNPYITNDKEEATSNTSFVNDTGNGVENKPPNTKSDNEIDSNMKDIAVCLTNEEKAERENISDENILYKVQLNEDKEDSHIFCNFEEIRPRARQVVDIKDVQVGQTYMLNHNIYDVFCKGDWYDFKVEEVRKLRTKYELLGTLYVGPDSEPQNDTRVGIHDKIFVIEKAVPITERTEEFSITPKNRSKRIDCLLCCDIEKKKCNHCGCNVCGGKGNPETIVLCDDCDLGFHIKCLSPPLTEVPEDDWYCPLCKRYPNDVIAPGAAKQMKKKNTSETNRDWGRGMACVGKTKTCPMPANHFGPIPGIEVGMCWRFRIQLSELGVHRPPVSGIHGRDCEGAYSIVLSGVYEDDFDNGYEFTYTGCGGRDLSGNKRTAGQSRDQVLARGNRALARNCAVKEVKESGGNAGKKWKEGKPVRVVRSYKMLKRLPTYAPKEGMRYDGIYKVVRYYPAKGISGHCVWKYVLRRDDPSPAPWEPEAKQFSIVYPDGYLEAEAEKKAEKERNKKPKVTKKLASRKNNSEPEPDTFPSPKRLKSQEQEKDNCETAEPKMPSMFSPKSQKKVESGLSPEEKAAIAADTLNSKLWDECLQICEKQGKKDFIEYTTQVFLCIICQDVAASPVTTPCLHNFCMACLKLAFKSLKSQICPCCRQNLSAMDVTTNDELMKALRTILTGYDVGKK